MQSYVFRNLAMAGAAIAAIAWLPATGTAQQGTVKIRIDSDSSASDEESGSGHWIGVGCDELPAALKSHLDVEQGLLVEHVAKDSPASRAGVKKHDILLIFGDKELGSVSDLVGAVEANNDREVDVKLLRGGKQEYVKITPAKRPAGQRSDAFDKGNLDSLIGELRKLRGRGGNFGKDRQMFWMKPGVILPRGVDIQVKAFPKDLSISINKQGDEPAKIKVKKGDESWEVSRDELDKLPDSVRPFVEQMLQGGMRFRFDKRFGFPRRIDDEEESPNDVEGDDVKGDANNKDGKGARARIGRFPRFEFRRFGPGEEGRFDGLSKQIEEQVRDAMRRTEKFRGEFPRDDLLKELREELKKQRREIEKLREQIQQKADDADKGETT